MTTPFPTGRPQPFPTGRPQPLPTGRPQPLAAGLFGAALAADHGARPRAAASLSQRDGFAALFRLEGCRPPNA